MIDPRDFEDDDFDNIPDDGFVRTVKIILVAICVLFIWCQIDYRIDHPKKPTIYSHESHFKNYDPEKKYNIGHLDYVNRTITYTTPAKPGQFETPRTYHSGRGQINLGRHGIGDVTLNIDGVEVNTGLTSEEILEQLDIDYNDVYDYYGIEMR